MIAKTLMALVATASLGVAGPAVALAQGSHPQGSPAPVTAQHQVRESTQAHLRTMAQVGTMAQLSVPSPGTCSCDLQLQLRTQERARDAASQSAASQVIEPAAVSSVSSGATYAHQSGPLDGSGPQADRPLDGTGNQWAEGR